MDYLLEQLANLLPPLLVRPEAELLPLCLSQLETWLLDYFERSLAHGLKVSGLLLQARRLAPFGLHLAGPLLSRHQDRLVEEERALVEEFLMVGREEDDEAEHVGNRLQTLCLLIDDVAKGEEESVAILVSRVYEPRLAALIPFLELTDLQLLLGEKWQRWRLDPGLCALLEETINQALSRQRQLALNEAHFLLSQVKAANRSYLYAMPYHNTPKGVLDLTPLQSIHHRCVWLSLIPLLMEEFAWEQLIMGNLIRGEEGLTRLRQDLGRLVDYLMEISGLKVTLPLKLREALVVVGQTQLSTLLAVDDYEGISELLSSWQITLLSLSQICHLQSLYRDP